MSITIVNKLAQTGTVSLSTSFTTSSMTTTTGRYYLFTVVYSNTATITSITTANGVTWVQQKSNANTLGNSWSFYTFGGQCTAGATGTFKINFSASVAAGIILLIDEVQGAVTTGPAQAVTGAWSTTSPISASLSAGGSGSAVYMACVAGSTSSTTLSITDKSGYSTAGTKATSGSAPSFSLVTEYNLTFDTSPNFAFSGGTSPQGAGIALEIAAASGGGSTGVPNSLMMMGIGI